MIEEYNGLIGLERKEYPQETADIEQFIASDMNACVITSNVTVAALVNRCQKIIRREKLRDMISVHTRTIDGKKVVILKKERNA